MLYRTLADAVLIVHLVFVAFVVLGGVLVLKWPWMMSVHLPAAVWGAMVECAGWQCPLTPLENWLREQAGQRGGEGDFVLRYLAPIVYPADLTRDLQMALGAIVLIINGAMYGWVWRRRSSSRNRQGLNASRH